MSESRSFANPNAKYLGVVVAVALLLGAVSVWTLNFVTPAHAQAAPAQMEIAGEQSVASGRSITNFEDAASRTSNVEKRGLPIAIHRPLTGRSSALLDDESDGFDPGDDSPSSQRRHRVRKADFPGGTDNGSVTPPDTQGTVGPNHLMAVLNSNVTIETRTGVVLSSVPIASFWSSLGINWAFDPRVLFDRYSDRWIISAGANAASPTACILIGVSQTNDPTGGWNLYKVSVDANGASWADYPTLGFNGDWIVVQANVFTVSQGAYVGSYVYAFDKAGLYAGGAGQYTVFHDPTGFTDYPAVTHDNTLATEYLVQNWSGRGGTLRISAITGRVGSEVLTTGVAFPKSAKAWNDSAAVTNFAPQLGSASGIDTDDDRIENCVYRNGSLWAAQTVFLPATGTPTRSSAQWWQINTASGSVGVVQQLGRRDDSTGHFDYAYPTLDVNANDDMMLGYSRFGATQYASANYSYRLHNDPPNTLEADTVFKSGEGPYFKDFGTGDNRWGDYSNVAVDPINDLDLWTIQEYAGPGNTWGTWWGTIELRGNATPTPTATRTPKPTPTRTPRPTRTPKPRRTPKPKRTPTATPTPVGYWSAPGET